MHTVRCPCGEAIIKKSYETVKQFERREKSGLCSKKCREQYPKHRPARSGGIDVEAPTKMRTMIPFTLVLKTPPAQGEYKGSFFKEVAEEDRKYLEFIRVQPCLICKAPGCEAHHQNAEGQGAKGARCSDRRAIPLCTKHHTMGGTEKQPGSYHGPGRVTGRAFLKLYKIDPEREIKRLNLKYDSLHVKRAA